MSKQALSKPTVAIVGAGRMGQALAIALTSLGHNVTALVARRRAKAEIAAKLLPRSSARVVLGANQLDAFPAANLILICTPDDAIEETAVRLAASLVRTGTADTGTAGVPPAMSAKREKKSTVVLHTSGALSSKVLSPLAKIGVHTGSLHPLVSVSDPRSGAKGLRGAFYCVEGDAVAARMAHKIVRDLKGKSFSVAPESKALYHAAALTAAGHLTALIDLAMDMLVSCGLNRKRAQEVLMPLVESAVSNLNVLPSEKALTGTFARGDLATVERHLAALANQTEALEVYKLLGLRSLKLADKKKIDSATRTAIKNLLE
jgi:predicted short-subunit dehydrogenase-like oxidoreductase (DUF2520 family)